MPGIIDGSISIMSRTGLGIGMFNMGTYYSLRSQIRIYSLILVFMYPIQKCPKRLIFYDVRKTKKENTIMEVLGFGTHILRQLIML